MQKDTLQGAVGYLARDHRRRVWKKAVSVLACVVVFCTTYALILPAITMGKTTYCGIEAHQHNAECYEKVLICGQEEPSSVHTHTQDCFADEKRLICESGKPEHEHTEKCYETVETSICGMEEGEEIPVHTHTEECYKTVLICGKEEHIHELSCYSDPEADVESAEDWSRSVSGVELTGDWRSDLTAVAESQLGYTESSQNYVVDEKEEKRGYTRYGAWYGDPYGEWDAMFASFCLHYADIPAEVFPQEASCPRWVETLKKETCDRYREKGDYEPETGDLIFFDRDGDWIVDHVGLIAERIEDSQGTLTEIETIEGDSGSQVKYFTYSIGDEQILGYGALPENPDFAKQAGTVPDSGDFPKTLTCAGEGYTVTVTYGADAALPEGVELRAEEYGRDSETFRSRFEEAAALYSWTEADKSSFRLFHIGLYLDGEEVEPAARVDVNVSYTDAEGKERCQVIHFGEVPEAVEAASDFDDGLQIVDFSANGFSDYGIMALADGDHPIGAVTGTFPISGVNLYSIGTAGGTPSPVEGVVYTVYRQGTEEVVGTYTTTKSGYSLELTDQNATPDSGTVVETYLPAGTYTVRQTSVPEGYTLVAQEKTFEVKDGQWNTAGTFFVYDAEEYHLDKTAQVHNYEERIYEEILTGGSGRYTEAIETGNFDFVIDRSNSMLFPTTLYETGVRVTLSNDSAASANNSSNMNTAIEQLKRQGHSADELYYIIALENTKATVYALWSRKEVVSYMPYRTQTVWYCQDASYYAKAQNAGDTSLYSDYGTGWNNNGCKLDEGSVMGSDLKKDLDANAHSKSFMIYTGSPYTRLTWLKYDMTLIVYQLAALNSRNTVTLTTFDADIRRCRTSTLDEDGVKDLIGAIGKISTSGGTAQDRGLQHVTGEYTPNPPSSMEGNCTGGSHLATDKKNFVILITDGALNNSANANAETDLKKAATKIRGTANTKLMTIGLSLDNVSSAQVLLSDTTGGGIASPGLGFVDKNAKEIAATVQNNVWNDLISLTPDDSQATVTDYISDSFYLVAPDGTALAEGDWITRDGNKVAYAWQTKAGQVCKDTKGWYVRWTDQTFPANDNNPWIGRLYVKAKEDFIGGNAIDTNKSAEVSFLDDTDETTASIPLETPTVNVRLLPVEAAVTEETVFLGDAVTPEGRIKDLLNQIQFTKIVTDSGGEVYNRTAADSAEGLEAGSFTLAYAMGQLTDAQWTSLQNGGEVRMDYTYDDASSHGAVGYFTLELEKTGAGSSYQEHSPTPAGKNVEVYTLTVNYTAYRFGESDSLNSTRPTGNVHITAGGTGGTQVGTGSTLENGSGSLASENIHNIHVVDGKITVTKEIEDDLRESADQTFTFTLHRLGSDGVTYEEVKDADDHPVALNVTVTGGQTTGTATLDTLPRGTYKLVEAVSSVYGVRDMTVETGGTNCENSGSGTKEVIFTIGTDTDGTDVIQRNSSSPYSTLRGSTPATGEACRGVSYGAVKVVNEQTVYMAGLPVEKQWRQVPESEYSVLTVYVALYQNDTPVEDADGRVLALALNQGNGWKGSFSVPLDHKDQNIAELGYSIRELSGITGTEEGGGNAAVVINEETESGSPVIYYDSAADSGLAKLGDKSYLVSYEEITSDEYTWRVINSEAYSLPEFGGPGTTLFTIGGLLLMAVAVGYGYRLRRRRERRRVI